jgi:hypothetical protein
MGSRQHEGGGRRRPRGSAPVGSADAATVGVVERLEPLLVPAGFVRAADDRASSGTAVVRYRADASAFVTAHPRTVGLLAPAGDPIELRILVDPDGDVRAELDAWHLEDLLVAVRAGPGAPPRRRADTVATVPRSLDAVADLIVRFLDTAARPT